MMTTEIPGHNAPKPSEYRPVSAAELAQILDATRKGVSKWVACCPAHADSKPSLSISEGKRVATVLRCHAGCSQEAVLRALGKVHGVRPATARGQGRNASSPAKIARPLPFPPGPLPSTDAKLGRATAQHVYASATGKPLFVHLRFEGPAGKSFRPRWWDGKALRQEWPDIRPLWNLHQLADARFAHLPVLVVEGEKTAEAAQALLPGYVVTTWPGGANSVQKADWTPLRGRSVVIWPDADPAGHRAADAITDALAGLETAAKAVSLPADLPEGWDLADPMPDGWDVATVEGMLADALRPAPASGDRPSITGALGRAMAYQALHDWQARLAGSPVAFALLFALMNDSVRWGRSMTRHPQSMAELAAATGFKDRALRAAVPVLEGFGLVERVAEPGKPALFRLCISVLCPAVEAPEVDANPGTTCRTPRQQMPGSKPLYYRFPINKNPEKNTYRRGGKNEAVDIQPSKDEKSSSQGSAPISTAPPPKLPKPVKPTPVLSPLSKGEDAEVTFDTVKGFRRSRLTAAAVRRRINKTSENHEWNWRERGQAEGLSRFLMQSGMGPREATAFLNHLAANWGDYMEGGFYWMGKREGDAPAPAVPDLRFAFRFRSKLVELHREISGKRMKTELGADGFPIAAADYYAGDIGTWVE